MKGSVAPMLLPFGRMVRSGVHGVGDVPIEAQVPEVLHDFQGPRNEEHDQKHEQQFV